jgi:uncharacterized protein
MSNGSRRRENVALVERIFAAFSRRDAFALRGIFAADAVWRVPGSGTMAGDFTGPDAILRFLGRLPKETDGSYRSTLIDVLASESRAAALYRASGTRGGRTLDIEQVLLFRIEDGLVRHVLALPSDPAAFEAFWTAG